VKSAAGQLLIASLILGDFMKTRTDPAPLSDTIKSICKSEEGDTFVDDELDDSEEYYVVEEDLDEEPLAKKQKVYQNPKVIKASVEQFSAIPNNKRDEHETRTIEYTLINEDTSEVVPTPLTKQYVDIDDFELEEKQDRNKRRSKAFGKYIAALMLPLNDQLFFEAQRDITTIIHEASMKQVKTKRS